MSNPLEKVKQMAILDVAQSLGMTLKKDTSHQYHWEAHDSLKIFPNKNNFSWFSKDKHGDVITLVQLVKEEETGQKVSFREARAYLKDERGLSDDTIDFFRQKGVLAEAHHMTGEYREPVIVFKTLDNHGEVTGGSLQGIKYNPSIHDKGRLKRMMRASDGLSGMHVDIGKPNRLVVAEAPIDLMSYYELHKTELKDVRLLAMDGLKEGTIGRHVAELEGQNSGLVYEVDKNTPQLLSTLAKLTNFFKDGKHADLITLVVDNDTAGKQFIGNLKKKGIIVVEDLPPLSEGQQKTDWNDYLKNQKEKEILKMTETNKSRELRTPFFSAEILDQYVEDVAQHYTDDIETAEYLFPDGRLVSSWDYGTRGDDHRAISNYFDAMGYPELDILDNHPKDFWNLVHNGIGVVRLAPETQTALILEGQTLTPIQEEILQNSSLTTEVYQESLDITMDYLESLGIGRVKEHYDKIFEDIVPKTAKEQVSDNLTSNLDMEEENVADLIAQKDTKALSRHFKKGVKSYLNSKNYKTFLKAMSKFHNYSPRNIQLILAQNPKASQVASFKSWKENFERTVTKGEKSLRIFAPMVVKQRDHDTGKVLLDKEGKEQTRTTFKLVPVFDVSQTQGKELPKPIYELEGKHEDYQNIYRATKAFAKSKGVTLTFDKNLTSSNGYYSPKNKSIVIKSGMSPQQTLKTIFHELAHLDLKHDPKNTNIRYAELQAESVAYVVASHFGFDTSDYSFGYLASWSEDKETLEVLENQLAVVQKEAKELIQKLDISLEQALSKAPKENSFENQLKQMKEASLQQAKEKEKEVDLSKKQESDKEKTK